jgi:hypothetical protein
LSGDPELIGRALTRGLAATLLLRFFTFWLPMIAGVLRRSANYDSPADAACFIHFSPFGSLDRADYSKFNTCL